MKVWYAGRRISSKDTVLYAFATKLQPELADPLLFSKMPATTKGWGIGTAFEAEVTDTQVRFGERVEEPVGSLLVTEVREAKAAWTLEDRAAQTALDVVKLRKGSKADELGNIDDLTIGQLRELMRNALPDRRRAMRVIVLERLP